MLIRISLILAIIAALGAGALNFFVVKDKLATLVQDRDTQKSDKEKAQTDLASTKKNLARTQNELSQSQQQLTESQASQRSAEDARDKAVQHAGDLSTQLAKTTQDRDDIKNQLSAYQNTGFTSAQVSKMSHDNKDLKDEIEALNAEKAVLSRKIYSLSNQLAGFIGDQNYVVRLPADLKGKVVQVDPKWDFVVLNIGEEQGVLANGELLVSRDGKLVAKVIVSSIEKNRCIANVVPGWKLGELFEGDVVSPAHPAS